MHVLRIVAAVLAVGSLVLTVLYVHDRRQRTPGLLLSGGVTSLIVAPMLFDERTAVIISAIALVPIFISAAMNIRSMRARSG